MNDNNNESNIRQVEQDHADMVGGLSKTGEDILKSLTPEKCHLWHMATGIATEAGEILDVIKKHVIYDQPLNSEHLTEECGDHEFYMEGIRQGASLQRIETLIHNLGKLAKRYENYQYSNQAAKERADK